MLISAISEILNTQTGHLENQPILSILIPRDTLLKIDFDFIDPSDSINNFIHNMEYNRIKGLQPVSMITKESFELE